MTNKRSTPMLSRHFGASCDYAMVHLAIFAVLVTAHHTCIYFHSGYINYFQWAHRSKIIDLKVQKADY